MYKVSLILYQLSFDIYMSVQHIEFDELFNVTTVTVEYSSSRFAPLYEEFIIQRFPHRNFSMQPTHLDFMRFFVPLLFLRRSYRFLNLRTDNDHQTTRTFSRLIMTTKEYLMVQLQQSR